jgi:hypothetical protein
MGLTRAHQIVTAELENHLPAQHGPDDIGIDICHGVAGHFQRKQLTSRVSVILAELVKVIGYLAITIGQHASVLLDSSYRFGLGGGRDELHDSALHRVGSFKT